MTECASGDHLLKKLGFTVWIIVVKMVISVLKIKMVDARLSQSRGFC